MIDVRRYRCTTGVVPITDWLAGLGDAPKIIGGIGNEEMISKRKEIASVRHTDAVIDELRADRAFAVEYLTAALEELDNPLHRAVGLLALRDVAEAYGGLASVAQSPV